MWIVFGGLMACSNGISDKSQSKKITANNASKSEQQPNAAVKDTLTMQKEELTKIYTQAIASFIKEIYRKDKIAFDTLYFGKHAYGQPDDFPDIALPQIIEKTQIRLVSPEIVQKKLPERTIYINMMGWVDKKKAAFLFVVFSNGAAHQYDYFIDFVFNVSLNKFELDKIEFENYLHLNGQKPERITIYSGGKYVSGK